jgi:hypothetical protein
MTKIFKSYSSPEISKLETLYSPNKGSPVVIKPHKDSDNIKDKSSSTKMSFWGSPDNISPGIEKLFNHMELSDKSKSLIIAISLCNIKNTIQLSNLDLDGISNLFSRKNLRDPDFQNTIVKILCLGNSFQISIREKSELKKMMMLQIKSIPTVFNEETDAVSGNNMDILKRHHMTCYWRARKDFLDYSEGSMSQDSLIGSTINTRSRRSVSCASNAQA